MEAAKKYFQCDGCGNETIVSIAELPACLYCGGGSGLMAPSSRMERSQARASIALPLAIATWQSRGGWFNE
jgi:hypothetical protein